MIKIACESPNDAMSENTNLSEPLLDRVGVLERVGGDRQLLTELVQLFKGHCPGQLNELQQAITAGDPARVERIAHSLKGALSNLGAEPASKSAMRLEEMGRHANLTDAEVARVALQSEIARAEKELTLLCCEVDG